MGITKSGIIIYQQKKKRKNGDDDETKKKALLYTVEHIYRKKTKRHTKHTYTRTIYKREKINQMISLFNRQLERNSRCQLCCDSHKEQ
mgnify:CR=1 FL=1